LTAIPESQKYKTTSNPINLDGVLLAGNDFTLSPLYNTNGLVGWWKFDEGSGSVAKDYSTNGNSGFLVNGPSWTAGRLAGGINFGDSRYINISANIINPGQGSISFWTKHGWDPLDNITHGWFQTDQGVNNPGWISFYKYGANNLDFRVRNNDVCCYATAGTGLNEASLYLIANQWTHITGTWDYSGAKLYVNGTLISSAEFGGLGVPTVSTSIVTLGVGHGASLNGIMDDVRIYNRALSAAEVKAIYDATK
jgi:hypothetical protein